MSVRVKQFFFLLILSAALLPAQEETATLRGTVLDSSGDPLANVTVTISETSASIIVRNVVTGKTGDFEAPFLKPGTYKITIEERGYQSYAAEGITLRPGQVRRYDPRLVTGSAEDLTEVRVAESFIDTQTGTLRDNINMAVRWPDAPVVEKIPSPFPLMVTTPGVQGNGNGLVISGISDRNRQTWSMDGISDDATVGLYVHPLLYEFTQVTSADPGPSIYRPVGFDLISKRGINGVHGQIYYKRGSSNFDANPYFSSQKSHYTLGEEGGDIGLQIFKGYTYAFGGFVRQTNPYSETLFANVPTAAMRLGNFGQYLNPQTSPTGQVVVIRDPRTGVPFPNNQIPTNRIATVSNNFMNNYYFGPNTGGDPNSVFQNYSWTHPFGPDLYKGYWPLVRIDQKLASSNNLYFRWMDTINSQVFPGSLGETLDSTQSRKYSSFAVSDNQVFSPGVVNHLIVGRTTDYVQQGESEQVTPISGDQVVNTTGLQGVNLNGYASMGIPTVNINGFTGLNMALGGGYSKNVAQDDHILTVKDDVEWSRGRHAIRFGVEMERYDWLLGEVPQLNYGSFNFTGQFTGLAFADFLLGYPATSSRILNPKINDKMHQNAAGAFIADSFRVSSRLTIDYGVRWDYFASPLYDDGYMYNWDPTTGNIIVAPGTITSVSTLLPKGVKTVLGNPVPEARNTNFHPHVSAAYRLRDNMVLRGGYAEFTDGGGYGPYGRINDPNGPFRLVETYYNSVVNGNVTYTFPKPFPSTPSPSLTPTPSISGFPSKTDEGVIRQYNLTLERSVRDIALRASYIGSRGSGLNYRLDINKAQPSPAPFSASRLPYPQFASAYYIRNDGQWHYDSAQVQATKKFGSLIFDTSFTLANNVSNYLNTYNPYNVTNQWSRDAGDRRRYFVASAVYELPVGKGKRFLKNAGPFVNFFLGNWTLEAISTLASGQYFTPLFTGPDPANASQGVVTTLPDCIGNPYAGARTIPLWFNPSAISPVPASAGRYGTCGVNSLESYPIRVAHASVAKRIPLGETLAAYFTVQVSNITNSANFLFPVNNISTPGAGMFTGASNVPDYYPEKQGARQLDLKVRLQW